VFAGACRGSVGGAETVDAGLRRGGERGMLDVLHQCIDIGFD
jgi:hypothetical protein